MEKLGLNFSRSSLGDFNAASASTVKAAVARGKVEIRSRDNKILELQAQLNSKIITQVTTHFCFVGGIHI